MYQLPESAASATSTTSQVEIWELEDIAGYLGISKGAARRLVAHPKFPFSVVNQSRNRRWFKDEVINYLRLRSKGEVREAPRNPINTNYIPKSIRVRQLKAVGS